jgi:hypothetical protein
LFISATFTAEGAADVANVRSCTAAGSPAKQQVFNLNRMINGSIINISDRPHGYEAVFSLLQRTPAPFFRKSSALAA